MIDLPKRFARDIDSKDTYLVPLIVINSKTNLSTGKLTMNGVHYDPLVKSIGKIKQFMNIL